MIRTGIVNTSYHTSTYQSVRKHKERSNIIQDTKYSLHFRNNWNMIKNPSDESAARPLVALQTRNACEAQSGFQVSCSDASLYPGANEVGGHDRGKHYLLSTYYSSTL